MSEEMLLPRSGHEAELNVTVEDEDFGIRGALKVLWFALIGRKHIVKLRIIIDPVGHTAMNTHFLSGYYDPRDGYSDAMVHLKRITDMPREVEEMARTQEFRKLIAEKSL